MGFRKTSGSYKNDLRHLSTLDKEILKILLNPHNGKHSSEAYQREQALPYLLYSEGANN
jgi:hypothetical protein